MKLKQSKGLSKTLTFIELQVQFKKQKTPP